MKFYREICHKLREGEPFKFSRWGDGEWGCMFGWQGKNRDGNEYLPELRAELLEIIRSEPDYYIGIQPGVLVEVGRGYVPDLREFAMQTLFGLNLNTVWGDVLHWASEFGHLRKFIDALNKRNVVIIGAGYFRELPYKNIVTPVIDSYWANDLILEDAHEYGTSAVFLVANAMNSNVIIDRLPDEVTAIDIGSVFDPYLGKPRATYQHNIKTEWLW